MLYFKKIINTWNNWRTGQLSPLGTTEINNEERSSITGNFNEIKFIQGPIINNIDDGGTKIPFCIHYDCLTFRFLEEEEYVGTIDNEGVLTMSVMPNTALRLWCGAVDYPPPRVTWVKEGENMPRSYEQGLVISPFTKLDEVCNRNGYLIRLIRFGAWISISPKPALTEDVFKNILEYCVTQVQ